MLHLTTHPKHISSDATVTIDILPKAGDTWTTEFISWDNPMDTKDSEEVNSFSVTKADSTQIFEVDIKHAFNNNAHAKNDSVSFKLHGIEREFRFCKYGLER